MIEYENNNFRSYKPRNDFSGAASSFELRTKEYEVDGKTRRKTSVFWVATKQMPENDKDGNNQFYWKDPSKTVTVKLDTPDIGEILAVLSGIKKNAGSDKGMYHANNHGNSSISFTFDEKGVYYVRLASKKEDGVLTEVKHSLTIGEGVVLKILLEQAIKKIYGW